MGWSASPRSWNNHGVWPLESVSKHKAQEINWDQSTCSPRQVLLGQPDGFPRQDGSVGQGTAGTKGLGLSGDVSTISHRTPRWELRRYKPGWMDLLLGAMGTGWTHRVAAQQRPELMLEPAALHILDEETKRGSV